MALHADKDATYNNQKLGFTQGADFAFFNNTKFSAEVLANMLKSLMTVNTVPLSGVGTSIGVSFVPAYGYWRFSAATAHSKCSMDIGLPSEGMRCVLDFGHFIADAHMSLRASEAGGLTGVSVQTASGNPVSTIQCSAGALLEMVCFTDGTWTIVQSNASVTADIGA